MLSSAGKRGSGSGSQDPPSERVPREPAPYKGLAGGTQKDLGPRPYSRGLSRPHLHESWDEGPRGQSAWTVGQQGRRQQEEGSHTPGGHAELGGASSPTLGEQTGDQAGGLWGARSGAPDPFPLAKPATLHLSH